MDGHSHGLDRWMPIVGVAYPTDEQTSIETLRQGLTVNEPTTPIDDRFYKSSTTGHPTQESVPCIPLKTAMVHVCLWMPDLKNKAGFLS